jgi:hypothetical protein
MKSKILFTISILIVCSCGTMRNVGMIDYGSPNIAQELLDDFTFKIDQYASDKTYGYTEENPIMVGAKDGGPKNQRRFLNALAGPNGEEIKYYRIGSCCPFKTNYGIYENSGLLDMYNIDYEGLTKSLVVFINMYDSDALKVPVGLELKK